MNVTHFSAAAFVLTIAVGAVPSVMGAGEKTVAGNERPPAAASSVSLEKRKADFVTAAIAFAKVTESELVEQRNHLWQRLGTMRQALSAWDEAISALERGTTLTASEAERRIALGRAYLERGRVEDGLRNLLAAEQFEAHRADVQTLLGEAYRRTGRLENAAESFRRASVLDPDDLVSSYWLGHVLSKLGQTERAREAWRQFHDRRQQLTRLDSAASPRGTSLAIAETPHQRLDRPSSLRIYFLRAPYRQALALFRKGRYDEAVPAFGEAASKDVVASSAYLHRSGVGDDATKLAKMLDDDRRALQTNPNDARRHLQLGEAYFATSKLEEARISFEKALALDQQLDGAALLLGHLALHAGKLDLARGHLEQAVQRGPDNVEARKLLGSVLAVNGHTEQALEHYRAAIRLRPDDEQPRMALAATLVEARRHSEAEQELLQAARDIPDSGQATFNLGRLYLSLGRQAEAIKAFETAASYPGFRRADLYALTASIYDIQLKTDQAVAANLLAVEANPSYVSTHGALAHLYLRRNLYAEALAELTAILVLDPQHVEAHTKMAQTYLRTGRYTDAAEAAGRALQLRPDHRDARYALAQALLRLGRIEDGRAELRKFQDRQATNLADEHRLRDFMALQQEATASVASGDHDKAIALFQRITEQQPHFGYWHLILARARVMAGRYDEALQSLEKARELSHGSLEMHRDYAEVYRRLGRMEDSERAHRAYLLEQEERRRKAVHNAVR
jgi:tetratricopeptide (TPR) repeat protein